MDPVAIRIFALADAMFPEQKDFAVAIGVSASVVSKWRIGITKSYLDRIAKIAEVLNTTTEYLLSGKEDIKEPADQTADGWELEAMRMLRNLPVEARERELAYLRSLSGGQGK